MDFNKFDVIQIGEFEYLVLNVIKFNNNTYLYLINNAEELDDVSVVKVIENNGVAELMPIDNDDEYNYVLNKLILENKDEIKELFSKENDNN